MPSQRIIELAIIGGHSGRVYSTLVNSEGVPVSLYSPHACGSHLTCHILALLPFAASCATTEFVAGTAATQACFDPAYHECCLSVLHLLAPLICVVPEQPSHPTRLAGSVTVSQALYATQRRRPLLHGPYVLSWLTPCSKTLLGLDNVAHSLAGFAHQLLLLMLRHMINRNQPCSVCCLAVQSFSLPGAWDHQSGVLASLNSFLWVCSHLLWLPK